MRQIIAAQGEVKVYKLESLPEDMATKATEKNHNGDHIISHSESGNHHVLPGDCDVMERTDSVPAGMQILYALLDKPGALEQDASVPHGKIDLDAGIYELRISREYDPFTEQARTVAD